MREHSSHPEAFVEVQPPHVEGYRITALLGVGGMATVWRAHHIPSGREVALKVFDRAGISSARDVARFNREVRLLTMLDHPLIARPHASGVSNDVRYYAMELIDGIPLDSYVRRQRLGARQVLVLFAAICRAVHHAHQRGVVHRDLKPGNILVDAAGQPHLVDFGLAEALGAGEACALGAGEVAGTPDFMSPEQASVHGGVIDARSDVYSLGAILFLLLTGEPPHESAGSYAQALRRIRTHRPRGLRELNPAVSRSLELLVQRTLEGNPSKRPQSAAELAALVERHATPLPRKLAGSIRRRIGNPLRGGHEARIVILALTAALAGPLRHLLQ